MNKVLGKIKTLHKGEIVKSVLTALAILFAVFSIVYFAILNQWDDMALSAGTILYSLVPFACERWFRFRIPAVMHVFVIIYAICPLLGSAYHLYLIFSWWDDMLHGFAGLLFAMLGAYFPYVLNKKNVSVALCALMAFAFSVAIAALWEFFEFGLDSIFGTDMQKDTWVYSVRPSDLLGKILGFPESVIGSSHAVTTTITNADGTVVLVRQGFLDIGLLDSMHDMLIETLGALIYTTFYIVFKGKKFVFIPAEKDNSTPIDITQDQEILQEVAVTQTDEPTEN